MIAERKGRVRFGPFEADLRSRELYREDESVPLQDQPFQVLCVLLEHAGQLVTREELRTQVWPSNTFVEFDHALNTAIKKIRIALSDDAVDPRYVQTFPKRGYRWIAPVTFLPVGRSTAHASSKSAWPRRVREFALGVLVTLLLSGNVQRTSRKIPSAPLIRVTPVANISGDPSLNLLCDTLSFQLSARLVQAGASATVAGAQEPSPYTDPKFSTRLQPEEPAVFELKTNLKESQNRLWLELELHRSSDEASFWRATIEHASGNPLEAEADFATQMTSQVRNALQTAGFWAIDAR